VHCVHAGFNGRSRVHCVHAGFNGRSRVHCVHAGFKGRSRAPHASRQTPSVALTHWNSLSITPGETSVAPALMLAPVWTCTDAQCARRHSPCVYMHGRTVRAATQPLCGHARPHSARGDTAPVWTCTDAQRVCGHSPCVDMHGRTVRAATQPLCGHARTHSACVDTAPVWTCTDAQRVR